jgi:hypothetical protein
MAEVTLFPVVHDECGATAFSFNRRMQHGDVIRMRDVVFDDGREKFPGMPVFCQHCKKPVAIPFTALDGSYHVRSVAEVVADAQSQSVIPPELEHIFPTQES